MTKSISFKKPSITFTQLNQTQSKLFIMHDQTVIYKLSEDKTTIDFMTRHNTIAPEIFFHYTKGENLEITDKDFMNHSHKNDLAEILILLKENWPNDNTFQ